MMMAPVSLEEQLIPGTLEYAINHVAEERLDLRIFDERYRNDETGRKSNRSEDFDKDRAFRLFKRNVIITVSGAGMQ